LFRVKQKKATISGKKFFFLKKFEKKIPGKRIESAIFRKNSNFSHFFNGDGEELSGQKLLGEELSSKLERFCMGKFQTQKLIRAVVLDADTY
jgi:hypothetical protein